MAEPSSGEGSASQEDSLRLFTQPLQVRSFILTAILVLMVFYTLYFARYIFIPVVLALLLNLLLGPAVTKLRRWYIPRPLGAALILGLMTGVVAGGTYSLIGPAQSWLENAPTMMAELERKTWQLRSNLQEVGRKAKEAQEAASDIIGDGEATETVDVEDTGLGQAVIEGAQWFAGILLLTLVMLYFMLCSRGLLLKKLLAVTQRGRARRNAVRIVRHLQHEISVYLLTVTAINIVLGTTTAVVLWGLGMPDPLLWGAIAGAFNFAPYIGAAVSWMLISVVGFVSIEGLVPGLMPSLAFFLLTFLEGNFVTPTVHGKRFAISPLVVFFSLLFWGWLWGIAGMLMAVPLVVVLKVTFDHIKELRPLGRVLGR